MNNLFYVCAIFILFFADLPAVIVKAPNLNIIEKEIKQLDKDALVVFDVDYTLIVPDDLILAPCGEFRFQEFMKNLRSLQEEGDILGSKISLESRVSLIDKEILKILSTLKQRNIKTIALTAMPTGKFGLIQNAEEWRVKQLDSLGLNFAWSFPTIDSISLSGFEGKKSQPVFKQGILASAKYPKGQVLVEFLKRIQWKPSKIIFIDDRMEYIESVEKELYKERIPVVSFYYTFATDQSFQLDKKIAEFQLNYLMQNGKWLSDEEAKKMLSPSTYQNDKPLKFENLSESKSCKGHN